MPAAKEKFAAIAYLGLPGPMKESIRKNLLNSELQKMNQILAGMNQAETKEAFQSFAPAALRTISNLKHEKKSIKKFYYIYLAILGLFTLVCFKENEGQLATSAVVHAILLWPALFSRSENHWRLSIANARVTFSGWMTGILVYCFLLITLGPVAARLSQAHPTTSLLIMAMILAPVFEEIFFRDYLLNLFSGKKIINIPAMIFSSVLFSAVHFNLYGSPIDSILYFFAGISLCILRWYSRTLLLSILVHAAYNITIIWL